MPIKQLVEKRNELAAKQETLADIFAEGKGPAGSNQDLNMELITSLKGTSREKLSQIRKMNEELDALGLEVDDLVVVDAAGTNLAKSFDVKGGKDKERFGPSDDEQRNGPKGIGDLFVESGLYEQFKVGGKVKGILKGGARTVMMKTDFTTSAGWSPESVRTGKVVLDAQRPIQVIDTVPGGQTGQAAIVYMEETTFTNAAAGRSENAAYAEATLATTQRSVTVESVGTSLPVTDEQLADEPQVRSYLNMRLGFMVRQRVDGYILTGSGSTPIIRGFNNLSGILTQALGGDNVPDAFYKAMRQVRVTGRAMPNVNYIHPTDWQGVRLLRTNDGLYIWGNPSEAGPLRLWGVTVVETDAQTLGTGLAGDAANFSQLFMRQDLTIEIGFVDDDFLDGRQTFRAGVRVALVGYRPQAFCQVTGL